MPLYIVDRNRCARCGTCSKLCPPHVIEKDEKDNPYLAPEREKDCIRCGHCVAYCPERCNGLSYQMEGEPYPVDASLFPSPESVETFMRTRRSTRQFKPDPVPCEVLSRILETLRYVPSAANKQDVRWIVLDSPKKVNELERRVLDFCEGALKVLPASDRQIPLIRYVLSRHAAGDSVIFHGAPQVAIAVLTSSDGMPEDGSIALTYLELAAHGQGVGCCWAGVFTNLSRLSPNIKKYLGISEGESISGAQMLGYPELELCKRLPPRNPLNLTWL